MTNRNIFPFILLSIIAIYILFDQLYNDTLKSSNTTFAENF